MAVDLASVAERVDAAITYAERTLLPGNGYMAGMYVIAQFLYAVTGKPPRPEELRLATREFLQEERRTLVREGLRLSFQVRGEHSATWEVRSMDEDHDL
jgi:hypothetical protein